MTNMNMILYDIQRNAYFIASRKRNEFSWSLISRVVDANGRVLTNGQVFEFANEKDAIHKQKQIIKTKTKRRGWVHAKLEYIPKPCQSFLEVPPEMRVTPEEMVMILREAQVERYVIFKNLSGLEDYFDDGVEYIGYEDLENNTIKVFDKFGTLRECFMSRMGSVTMTERAKDANKEMVRRAADGFRILVEEKKEDVK